MRDFEHKVYLGFSFSVVQCYDAFWKKNEKGETVLSSMGINKKPDSVGLYQLLKELQEEISFDFTFYNMGSDELSFVAFHDPEVDRALSQNMDGTLSVGHAIAQLPALDKLRERLQSIGLDMRNKESSFISALQW